MYMALDTETELVRQGLLAPPLVCLTWAEGETSGIVTRTDAKAKLDEILTRCLSEGLNLVGQNIAYDMGVLAYEYPEYLPVIFELYDRHQIHDTMLRDRLLCLARGELRNNRFSLADIAERRLGLKVDKEDTYRKRYGELRLVPLDEWPADARAYAVTDAEVTLRVFHKQTEVSKAASQYSDYVLDDGPAQAKYAFGFQLMCIRGVKVDPEATKKLEKKLRTKLGKLRRILTAEKILDKHGTKKTKVVRAKVEAAFKKAGLKPELTATKKIATDAAQLSKVDDKGLNAAAEFTHVQKMLNTYIKALSEGDFEHPITPSMQTLLETGRTSMRKPNLQNLPRAEGLRECFVPRKGFYFCMVDFDTAELRSLAQACLSIEAVGRSELSKVLNAGGDPHLTFAASMLGISPEEAQARHKAGDEEVANMRQRAKAANFGFPGGMGVARFIDTQARMGVEFTEEEAKALKSNWLNQWPEMLDYFKHINDDVVSEPGVATSLVSRRDRGQVGFCDAANNYFQALTADGAKAAVYALVKAMYTDPCTPLKGCHLVNFIHDEVIVEVPIATAHEAAEEIVRIMCSEMNKYTPDVPAGAQAAICDRWYKGAKPVYKDGRLTLWQPKVAPPKNKSK